MKRSLLLLSIGLLSFHAQAQGTCTTAVPVVLASYFVPQVDGAEPPAPVCASGSTMGTLGRWYVYTATMDTAITVTTDLPQNSGGDTRVHIYTGTCGNLTCHAGDDDSGAGYLSVTTFNVVQGQAYYIAFDNRWSASGFTFKVMHALPPPPVYGFVPQYVPISGQALCIVDMNGDGLDDAVSVTSTEININYQNPGGGFTNQVHTTTQADYTPSWSLCAGDLDGNGYNDLVYAGSGLTFMLANDDGNGYTELSHPQYIFCQRSNLVDINNDGLLDAFSCHDVAPNVYYINNGDGSFTWNQGGLGDRPDGGNYGSIWIDYNNDGLLDMFIAKCRGASSPASIDELWRNNGDGTFTNVAQQMNLEDFHQSWSAAWGDFDNDGDMDVLIGTSSFSGGGHKLMRNDGTVFTNVTVGSGFDLYSGTSREFIARDFNNDGYVDVLGGGSLMMNNGDMTFTMTQVPFNNGPTGDLNNDGFVDVQNGNTIYLNAGNDNNWIKVITVGTASNINGIGARVEITSAMGTQIRDVVSGDGFEFMSSLTTHFGIGTDVEVTNVTVRWPSGMVSSIDHPAANATLTVVEGDLTTAVEAKAPPAISLYPSPARDLLHVSTGGNLAGSLATIADLTGKVVAQHRMLQPAIDVSQLASGLYLLQVEGPTGALLSARFVKE